MNNKDKIKAPYNEVLTKLRRYEQRNTHTDRCVIIYRNLSPAKHLDQLANTMANIPEVKCKQCCVVNNKSESRKCASIIIRNKSHGGKIAQVTCFEWATTMVADLVAVAILLPAIILCR